MAPYPLSSAKFHWLSALIICFSIRDSYQGENEARLYKHVLDGYEALARPVKNESDAVIVSLGISLQQLVDIDEKNQVIILNVWLTYKWRDDGLQWEPKEYGNVKEIRLPPSKIWKPDVLLYNSADESFDSTYSSNVVVMSDGTLEWIPPGIIKGTCKIDIQYFPFDDQHCSLKFGSWTFSGALLDLRVGDVNLATYTTNGEWDLMNVTPFRNEFKYDCCPDPYYDVTFTIHVRRRTLYYGFNLIIPCLLISFMTLLDFTLPPDSGEKLSLGVTIFMSLCVFLLMIAEALPPTSDAVPLIGTYFCSIMVVVSASVVFTVLVLNIHHRNPTTHQMGGFTKAVFLNWLPWLLMMNRPGYISRRGRFLSKDESVLVGVGVPNSNSKSLMANILDLDDNSLPRNFCNGLYGQTAITPPPLYHNSSNCDLSTPTGQLQHVIVTHMEPILQGIYKELKHIADKMREAEEEECVINDWKFAAMVIDRLSLLIFTTVLVLSTCVILFSAPHIL